eukprot:TRINITY_DN931_c0_g1_i4.p1 TRINITY_DN931_c0_g1~~TRINITY_DN931_c0_g1_i4.p1  ORF type:complete len:829 (+),score=85.99 TRINITY_DN931_c0_g1_i4:88-2574(+)
MLYGLQLRTILWILWGVTILPVSTTDLLTVCLETLQGSEQCQVNDASFLQLDTQLAPVEQTTVQNSLARPRPQASADLHSIPTQSIGILKIDWRDPGYVGAKPSAISADGVSLTDILPFLSFENVFFVVVYFCARPLTCAFCAAMYFIYKHFRKEERNRHASKQGHGSGLTRAQNIYFSVWNALACICFLLSERNIIWDRTTIVIGLFVLQIQTVMHWLVLEIPMISLATLVVKTKPVPRATAQESHDLTVVMNYNLLATCTDDIDSCMENMLNAYLENVDSRTSAVLVSATSDPELKSYELQTRDRNREVIYKDLHADALRWYRNKEALGQSEAVDCRRHLWEPFRGLDEENFNAVLESLCHSFAKNYMVIHRVSRVLRKCGQYQDLMLLSEGHSTAYTYCNKQLYGKSARTLGEPLFTDSEDVRNVLGRKFDYTLVLDADTRVEGQVVNELRQVAKANPGKDIIQPAIRFHSTDESTVFSQIEKIRQEINAPTITTLVTLYDHSPFFGKGLIRNKAYHEKCLGFPDAVLDTVPIDVLSHDTYEAAVMDTMFVPDIFLIEDSCSNFISWSSRETRWNKGELILASHFWPNTFGKWVRCFQMHIAGATHFLEESEAATQAVANLSQVARHLAHGPLKTMGAKFLLLVYCFACELCPMYWKRLPLAVVMFFIVILPKMTTITWENKTACLVEMVASICQFTPEAVVGSVRIIQAMHGYLWGSVLWTPQAAIEAEFLESNAWAHAIKHLWPYSLASLIIGAWVAWVNPCALHALGAVLLVFVLPFYVGCTSHYCIDCPSFLQAVIGFRLAGSKKERGDVGHAMCSCESSG